MDVDILIWAVCVLFLVFLINYLFFIMRYKKIKKQSRKNREEKIKEFIGFSYIIPKFNLDVNKMNLNVMFLIVSVINAFIISGVFLIVYIVPWGLIFQLLLGFVLLFFLIYAIYEILGRYLVWKGWVK